ncbi:hypothetical protein PoB_004392600 [Plakobranchus ocellatus]|uniref:Uncharacterized protein n=1 Tax=Plakobranchus ocellatus TaxID=259542 RepID=A0AAV4BAJ2_9GAST|nr:hypothetical protein PoB_004392600 [Plakobranchus ocellatus]
MITKTNWGRGGGRGVGQVTEERWDRGRRKKKKMGTRFSQKSTILSDNEAWVATVSQPEKTTCGGAVPELLSTALTLRLEGDPASRGRPYVKRQTYAPRETLRPEGDPTSRGRPKVDFEVPLIFSPRSLVSRVFVTLP